MRVAFFVDVFPALSDTFILNQMTGLIDRGHELDIYAYHKSPSQKVHDDITAYALLDRTTYLPAMPANRLLRALKGSALALANLHKNPRAFLNLIRRHQHGSRSTSVNLTYAMIPFLKAEHEYDIIHCHQGLIGIQVAFLRQYGLIKGKLLTTFYGYDVTFCSSTPSGKQWYQHLFEQGDWYIAISTFISESAVALGCPPDKISKLPVGLKMSDYHFTEKHPNDDGKVNILTVGRLSEKKGMEFSITAVAQVAKKHPNIQYNIVGDGPLHEPLQQLINDLGAQNNITLLGWHTQQEVQQLYNNSHIFMLTSVTAANGDKEGQALVLQEAQAAGLPVISTIHNGIPEGVIDGQSAFLVPERDVPATADRLTYLIEHAETWPKMGAAGRNFVQERYNTEHLADQLVNIYQHTQQL